MSRETRVDQRLQHLQQRLLDEPIRHRTPSVLTVGANQPFKDFREMLQYLKQNPGKVRIGTAGVGLGGGFLRADDQRAHRRRHHHGGLPRRGGHIEGVILALGTMTGHVKSAAVRGMVISTKVPAFLEIPTLAELGYAELLFGVWAAFFAPAGVPAEVTKVLVPAMERAIKHPATVARLQPLGNIADYAAPEKLTAEIRAEQRRVSDNARKAGLIKQ